MAVDPGNPLTGFDEADILLQAELQDIVTPAGADHDPNPAGADLTAYSRLRITDLRMCSGVPCSAPYNQAGTTTDSLSTFPIDCAVTSDPSTGAICAAETSADALNPGFAQLGRSTVAQSFRVLVDDAGANGVRGDSDDRIFATQGFYVP